VAVATGLALAVGVVFRFISTSPLWLDEALNVNIASLPLDDIGGALRHDGHPPLFYWLLHGWMDVVGDGNVAARSLSGALSVAALPLMWMVGDRVGGPRVARWSLVLLALSPFAVRYATEARMYSLVMLLVLALALLLDRVLQRPRPASVLGLALVTTALLWSHYWSFYLLAVVGGLLLLRWWRDPAARAPTGWAIAGLAGGGVLLAPWVPALLDQMAHTGTPWAPPVRPTVVAQVTLADLGGGGFAEALLAGAVLAVLVVGAFAHSDRLPDEPGPLRPLDERVLAVVAGGTLLLGSAIAFVTSGAYASRYASVVAPLVLVVAAVGITRLRPTWVQVGVVAVGGILVVAAIGNNAGDQRTQADDIAAELAARAGPDDVVVICPDQLGPSLEREVARRRVPVDLVPYPAEGDPRFVDWRDYEERNDAVDPDQWVADLLARVGGRPLWLVWNGGYRTFTGDCEALAVLFEADRGVRSEEHFGDAFESANLSEFGARVG
jgi:mannosyltransferase